MLKRAIVGLLGRERANRVSAPFYDWQARRRTLRNLAALPSSDLCINLGCGSSALEGWVNVDIARGARIDVVWDLRRALPFPDESCTAIFSEHVIEHVSQEDAEKLLKECHRILQTGGVLRLSTPDAGRYLRSYAGDREFLRHPSFPQAVETPIDRINIMMREGGQHLWVYDSDSLLRLLRRVGFTSATEQQFGVSQHPRMQNIDLESRAFESLYVEAVK
jgi:predicted SAM-dependent methyltransferase